MEQNKDTQQKQQFPILNGQYEIIESLGEGKTSRVYLCRHIDDHDKKIALKLLRSEFIQKDASSIKSVEQEIQILHGLEHDNVTKILGYGSDGKIIKPSGREIINLIYIMIEYVPGGIFFNLCQTAGAMGEKGGRLFMEQLLSVLAYLNHKKVAHRDLKLENILVDEHLNLKVADFGFATFRKVNRLKSFRGTKTYMAPEIKEHKVYDGMKADMFSVGVILFIIVQGIFPFSEAKPDEYYYKMLMEGKNLEKYWKKTGGETLSGEFKDLILRMLNYDPEKRPSIEELTNHPWMKMPFEQKKARNAIIQLLQEKKSEKSTQESDSVRPGVKQQKSAGQVSSLRYSQVN